MTWFWWIYGYNVLGVVYVSKQATELLKLNFYWNWAEFNTNYLITKTGTDTGLKAKAWLISRITTNYLITKAHTEIWLNGTQWMNEKLSLLNSDI